LQHAAHFAGVGRREVKAVIQMLTVPPKPKRKRKPRYPKNFDPENPGPAPDPERWLPKHERAEFRKRRKRSQRNQPVSKGAQVRGPCLLLVREVLSPVACI
jgi:SRP72 RNA-binding domain